MEDDVRTFRLHAGGHSVELCNVGASITALCFDGCDMVLGYASNQALHQSANPFYFGGVVGRVANRIANGHFEIQQGETIKSYQLELNDGPNHLHGGHFGFHRQIWKTEILSDSSIQFKYFSPDGDQGYPGSVLISALYSLTSNSDHSLGLALTLSAQLLPCENGTMLATPINLAQHSYFNLNGHDSNDGILSHVLWMPQSTAFLPVNDRCLPTKQVLPLHSQEAQPVDFRCRKNLLDALTAIAQDKFNNRDDAFILNIFANRDLDQDWEPFGIDNSFVLDPNCTDHLSSSQKALPSSIQPDLHIAAVLEHPGSRRRLTVYTDAPAVQVYTGHYLNRKADKSIPMGFRKGINPHHEMYPPFSGICLETQHYPDSIGSTMQGTQGQCPILVPGLCEVYRQRIEYHFDVL